MLTSGSYCDGRCVDIGGIVCRPRERVSDRAIAEEANRRTFKNNRYVSIA
jgi:hypothetical protein